jgi:hypothetical protein
MGTRVSKNATPVPVKIVGGSSFGRYTKINNEHTWNMFISEGGDDEKKDRFLVNYPGYQKYIEITPEGKCRGEFLSVRGDFVISVVNQYVYKILPNKQVIPLMPPLITYKGEVTIAENLASQICICDGTNAYIYYYGSPNNTLVTQTLDPGNLIPNYVEYHNSFFLFGNGIETSNGSTWYVYSPDGNTSLTLSKQLALQTKSDFALAVKKIPGQANNVMVFGRNVAEIWTQVGGLQFYIRNPTRNIDFGCVSVSTIAIDDQYIVWLAQNENSTPTIVAYDGQQTARISTDGIDYKLRKIQYPQDSTAFMDRIDGHLIYQLTFFNEADNWTLFYDFNTKLFFEATDQYFNYHPAQNIIYFNGKRLFSSLNNGALYELNSDITVINENVEGDLNPDPDLIFQIPRERITNSIRAVNAGRFRANSLAMTLEQGVDPGYQEATVQDFVITEQLPLVTNQNGSPIVTQDSPGGDGYDSRYVPCIDLAVSRDGGVTWNGYVRRRLHPLGKRQNELHWENMGLFNDLQFKFRFMSNVRWIVNNGVVDIINV